MRAKSAVFNAQQAERRDKHNEQLQLAKERADEEMARRMQEREEHRQRFAVHRRLGVRGAIGVGPHAPAQHVHVVDDDMRGEDDGDDEKDEEEDHPDHHPSITRVMMMRGKTLAPRTTWISWSSCEKKRGKK